MLVDSHCHLDFDVFDEQRDILMKQCIDHDVLGFLVPATTHLSWSKIQNLATRYSQWRIAYGLHPYFLKESSLKEIEFLAEQCEATNNTVAVGEIGLDHWEGAIDMDIQMAFFVRQLSVAKSINLPVILHARKSYDLVLKCLRDNRFKHGGIVHAFNGSIEQAKRFIDLGFVLGIGGTVTYPRAKKSHRVLQSLSADDFVLETDAPDMPLYGFQGKINTPLSIPLVAQCVAQIRDETVEQISAQTYDNLLRVFPKWHEVLL